MSNRSSIGTYIASYLKHARRDLRQTRNLRHWISDLQRLNARIQAPNPVSYPLHALSYYKQLLQKLQNDSGTVFRSLPAHVQGKQPDPQRVNIVLRHDVDAGEPQVVEAFCQIEKSLGLRSSVHILVDKKLYDPTRLIPLAGKLHAEGFDVGLHTQAWMQEDYRSAFHNELEQFEALFGFPARTFTQHGAWPRTDEDMARRRKFIQKIPQMIAETSLLGYNNRFEWVSEDSNVKGSPAAITEHFFQPNELCYIGGVALILTHDNHWQH
ncbi:MAG: hypothetical protein AAF702_25070 [Chloroflexota bacterium]